MVSVVVPFRAGGKSRLPEHVRAPLALAMLGDVLEAAVGVGRTVLVTSDEAAGALGASLAATVVPDPGEGQGAAVECALAGVTGVVLVVNADLPSARTIDLLALAGPALAGHLALVRAADGTTNALGLPSPAAFRPLYGPGSADRFISHAWACGLVVDELAIPALVADVDTLTDLEPLAERLGSRARRALAVVNA